MHDLPGYWLNLSCDLCCLIDKPLYLPDAVRQPERAMDSPLRPISRDVSSRISHFPSQVFNIIASQFKFITIPKKKCVTIHGCQLLSWSWGARIITSLSLKHTYSLSNRNCLQGGRLASAQPKPRPYSVAIGPITSSLSMKHTGCRLSNRCFFFTKSGG